jgi:hypothetical protein
MAKWELTPEIRDSILTELLRGTFRRRGYTYTREQTGGLSYEYIISHGGDELLRVRIFEDVNGGNWTWERPTRWPLDNEERWERQVELTSAIKDAFELRRQAIRMKHEADLAREVKTQPDAKSVGTDYDVGLWGKPGRPRNEDDDWACRQFWELNRDREELYNEWRARIGLRAKRLADPRDSFNKAIREQRWKSMQE